MVTIEIISSTHTPPIFIVFVVSFFIIDLFRRWRDVGPIRKILEKKKNKRNKWSKSNIQTCPCNMCSRWMTRGFVQIKKNTQKMTGTCCVIYSFDFSVEWEGPSPEWLANKDLINNSLRRDVYSLFGFLPVRYSSRLFLRRRHWRRR